MSAARLGASGRKTGRLCAWLSAGINVVFYGGSPDETLSGRSYRMGDILGDTEWLARRKKIDRLFFWQADHCRASHAEDVAFARSILEFEAMRSDPM